RRHPCAGSSIGVSPRSPKGAMPRRRTWRAISRRLGIDCRRSLLPPKRVPRLRRIARGACRLLRLLRWSRPSWRGGGSGATGGGGWAIGRYQVGLPEPDSPVFRRLTFRHGNILHARFTADGQTVVYSAAFEGNPPEIFSARADATGSRALGIPRADLLAVSPKG